MKLQFKNSLSLKLLRIALLSAVVVGGVLSCAQIVFDAYRVRQAVTLDAERILDMFRDPSTQALYSLDREMALQVIEGMFQDGAVRKGFGTMVLERMLGMALDAKLERIMHDDGIEWRVKIPDEKLSANLSGQA